MPVHERSFVEAGRSGRLIPGVHHYCDEWCVCCPLTERCLAYRCLEIHRRLNARGESEPTFRTEAEHVTFVRAVAAAEGLPAPELDAVTVTAARAGEFRTGDPLARLAWEYALGVSVWLVLSSEELDALRARGVPSPEEVVLWYHLRIYTRLVRASAAKERGPGRARRDEEHGCAKLALVCIQRSRRALMQLRTAVTVGTIGPLLVLLERIESGIDERFPGARKYVRVGLDVPAA